MSIDHVVVPLLAIVAGQIGAARRIEAVPAWGERLGLWTTLVGFSGTGKTPGLNATKRVLEAVERDRADRLAELRRQHETRVETAKAAYKRWKDDVAEAVANGATPPPMPPEAEDPGPYVEPRLYVSDTTVEKLAVLIKARPRGALVIVDELAGLFANMGRYTNGSDREFWLTAWMGDGYVVERLSRTVRVPHLLVSMTGGFQPDKLSTAFKGDDDGMHARLLFSWPAEPPYRELSDEIRDIEPGIYNAFVRLVDLPAGTGEVLETRTLGFTTEAKIEFESFRYTHHNGKHALDGREREWWAKGPVAGAPPRRRARLHGMAGPDPFRASRTSRHARARDGGGEADRRRRHAVAGIFLATRPRLYPADRPDRAAHRGAARPALAARDEHYGSLP